MRNAPTSAKKVVTFPSGIRLDRAVAILKALKSEASTIQEEQRYTLHTLSDGSIAVYRHYGVQS